MQNALPFQIVAVRILISVEGESKKCFPLGNRIGALLLHKVLNDALKKACLLYDRNENLFGVTGDLNDSYFQVAVTGAPSAIRAIIQCLDETCLLPCAIVAWFDFNELIWRVAHPAKLNVTFESLIPPRAGWEKIRRRIESLTL